MKQLGYGSEHFAFSPRQETISVFKLSKLCTLYHYAINPALCDHVNSVVIEISLNPYWIQNLEVFAWFLPAKTENKNSGLIIILVTLCAILQYQSFSLKTFCHKVYLIWNFLSTRLLYPRPRFLWKWRVWWWDWSHLLQWKSLFMQSSHCTLKPLWSTPCYTCSPTWPEVSEVSFTKG